MLTDPLLAPVRLLEVAHVAHRLSVSPWLVRQFIHKLELPAIRVGARWRVDPQDLQAFIDARRIAALSQRIAAREAALDHELVIAPRGRDGPRESTVRPQPHAVHRS